MAAACCCPHGDDDYDCDSDVESLCEEHVHGCGEEVARGPDHQGSQQGSQEGSQRGSQRGSQQESETSPAAETLAPTAPGLINSAEAIEAKYAALIVDLEARAEKLGDVSLRAQNALNDAQLRITSANATIEDLQRHKATLETKLDAARIQLSDAHANLVKIEGCYLSECERVANAQDREKHVVESMQGLQRQVEALEKIRASEKAQAELEKGALESQIGALEEKNAGFEAKAQSEMERLSNYLYVQYAQKHESKVQELKSLYRAKLEAREGHQAQTLASLRAQLATATKETQALKAKLGAESAQKQKLIKLWDDYAAMDKENVVDLQAFLKSIK